MKKLIIAIAILFIGFNTMAQTDPDSLIKTYENNPITVTLPVKAIVLHGYYAQLQFSWKNRLLPDAYKPLVGSGTKPDSLVTVTIGAEDLSAFVVNLIGERYGAISTHAGSILNNSPSMPGYTSLVTQVGTKAAGNGAQKNAAEYVAWRYNKYIELMQSLATNYWNVGLNWIRN